MFIKVGDGKILDVINENELTENQKKSVKKVSEVIKQSSNESADTSKTKKSGS
jgi:hypothetical protein